MVFYQTVKNFHTLHVFLMIKINRKLLLNELI